MNNAVGSPHITYIGHATLRIALDGVTLLTDPVLRQRVAHLHHRQGTILPAALQDIDAVLISHLHFDHLDIPSLKLLGTDIRLIVPQGAGRLLQRQGFTRIEEIAVGQATQIKSLTIEATYADHNPKRHPFGPEADTLGYLVHGSYSIYFAGDTDLFPEMAALTPTLDVALLPVWGWGPTLGQGHLDPRRAAEALTLLDPRLAIPIHWGSLHPIGLGWLKPRFLHEPPDIFAKHAAELVSHIRVEIVDPGQTLSLPTVIPDTPLLPRTQ